MMHADEIKIDAEQVRRLIAEQFPQWAGLLVTQVAEAGTDHTLYRLGDDLVARLPRMAWALDQIQSDRRWLSVLAPHLPLPVPAPVAIGEPGAGFPWPWSVVPWLTGENPTTDNLDRDRAAVDLAAFITAMHGVDTTGGPVKRAGSRGGPLAGRDEATRTAIAELGDRVDTRRVVRAWDEALSAGSRSRTPVWLHGDLQGGNMLVHQRRLSAVIDFGGLGVGDPAVDLMSAWSIFDAPSRLTFREALACDDDTWQRAKGWALSTALVALPYYWDTFPGIVAESHHKIAAVLSDRDRSI
jgi:aminoglycoside phosphotransferase (APT) family kinase protein